MLLFLSLLFSCSPRFLCVMVIYQNCKRRSKKELELGTRIECFNNNKQTTGKIKSRALVWVLNRSSSLFFFSFSRSRQLLTGNGAMRDV